MANMLNSAHNARERTLKILNETEKYVSGVNKEGKKILCYFIEQVKDASVELNRAIGEMDNILPQYGDTSAKNEMLELRSMLEDRERILRDMVDRK
ncbi:MAG: hypothetical protein IJ597_05605 [Synergistaceae bacterium]|nr:hypothetical protein [Synergistaceae bacterium]